MADAERVRFILADRLPPTLAGRLIAVMDYDLDLGPNCPGGAECAWIAIGDLAEWLQAPTDPKPAPCWGTTFNTDHSSWGIRTAWAAARSAGYPYIAWNGWVYSIEHFEPGGDGSARIMKAEDLT